MIDSKRDTVKTINIHEAKTHLSRILDRVAAGEDVVIARAGKPIARLVPITPRQKTRTAGGYAGRIHIASDFDDPLPDDVLESFEGGV